MIEAGENYLRIPMSGYTGKVMEKIYDLLSQGYVDTGFGKEKYVLTIEKEDDGDMVVVARVPFDEVRG